MENRNGRYKAYRIVYGKPRWIIVNENGDIINKNPVKDILKGLDKFPEKKKRPNLYKNEELLNYLKQFVEENGRIPVRKDFDNNPFYPHFNTYAKHFGSWQKALKLVELDVDTIVKNGTIENEYQKEDLLK